jgi:hypothetical protein
VLKGAARWVEEQTVERVETLRAARSRYGSDPAGGRNVDSTFRRRCRGGNPRRGAARREAGGESSGYKPWRGREPQERIATRVAPRGMDGETRALEPSPRTGERHEGRRRSGPRRAAQLIVL